MEKTPAAWSVARFGDDARRLRTALGAAMSNMQDIVLDAQAHSGSETQYVAGAARRTNQFDRVCDRVMELELPETYRFRPDGVDYDLVVVQNTILFPYRDGTVLREAPGAVWPRDLSNIVRELFTFTGKPIYEQPTIEGMASEVELRPKLARLPENTQLVLVPYLMNKSGVLRAWWGRASLVDEDGGLAWKSGVEELPIPMAAQQGTRPNSVLPQQREDEERFDSGTAPEVPLMQRSEIDKRLEVPPETETDSIEAKSQDHDQD
ncbi:hypothetical protein [Streptomonospora salina]|uniref:Uncharacterized protein n=1 Tax=Streptomonospora salina TaxID=104205 RepID=A0A841EG73_9ACTN|nr:hypothetical protein [Streptomonospora salina]MBB5998421.1 hypothetical protein [Streptomonospora salina]